MEGAARFLMMAALFAIHLGLAMVLASIASHLWLRGAASSWASRTRAQALALARIGGWVTVLAMPLALWAQAAAMGDTGLQVDASQLALLLGRTHYGHAWIAGLAAWLIALALLWKAGRLSRLLSAMAAIAIFVFTRSIVSHAGAQGDFTIDVLMDWLHLTLVCLWLGMVVAGSLLALPGDVALLGERRDAGRWIDRMSMTATIVLVVIGLTGVFKVWEGVAMVGSWREYLASAYGFTLVVKLALVGVGALLGGLNKFLVLPPLLHAWAADPDKPDVALDVDDDAGGVVRGDVEALAQDARAAIAPGAARRWRKALTRALHFELVVLTLVLLVAAALSSTELPGL